MIARHLVVIQHVNSTWIDTRFVACGACALLLLLSGCGDSDPSRLEPPPVATAIASADDGTSRSTNSGRTLDDADNHASDGLDVAKFDGIRFTIPAGWKTLELSDMQRGIIDAKYAMPSAGEEVTLTCSSASGGIEANLDRWRGQFTGASEQVETVPVQGTDATWIQLTGQFSGGFGRAAESEWSMIGVAIPLGQRDHYLKLTGPADQVNAARDELRDFVRSGRFTP